MSLAPPERRFMKVVSSLSSAITKHTIEVLVALLVTMILSRSVLTYGRSDRILYVPESAFASAILGRDLADYTVMPVYEIRAGVTPSVFGYGSPLVAFGAVSMLEHAGICRADQPNACASVAYQGMLVLSFFLYIIFIYKCFTDSGKRLVAFIIFAIFLLGVPMNKAIEAGNIDIILSPILGLCYLRIKGLVRRRAASANEQILLGLALGILLNMKLFIVPFIAVLLLFVSPSGWVTGAACIIGFVGSALWPKILGVPAGLFDVVAGAMRNTRDVGPQLYTQINYGNNAVIGYISNILQAFDTHRLTLPIHRTITNVLSIITMSFLLYLPFRFENVSFQKIKKIFKVLMRDSSRGKPVIITLLCIVYVMIITLPTWSYDYRIVYSIPVMFLLFNEIRDTKSESLLFLSAVFLLTKCLWIPKDRIMTIFLYIHMFYLLTAGVSLVRHNLLSKAIGKS